jgi:hypothetical protein
MVPPPILLHADNGLRRLVTGARVKRCTERVRRELPIGARQRRDLESAQRRVGAAFAGNDVGCGMCQDLIARPAMDQRGRDIAHGAGGHEHGGFLAEQIGHAFAERIHGRVVADLLVTHLSARHRLAHPWRRAGLGVRQQVDADGRRLGIRTGRGVGHGEGLFTGCVMRKGVYLNRRFSRES